MEDDSMVRAIANEIARYLELHPGAADSAKGIQRWWIGRQRLEESLADTQRALDCLEKQGVVVKRTLGDQTIYSRVRNEPGHDSDGIDRVE